MTDALEPWSDFNVAMLGATAALAGLVIVAMSVNISEIVKSRTLPSRLAAGISALVLTIVASGTGLIPGMDVFWYGAVLLAATAIAGAFQVRASVLIFTDPEPVGRGRLLKAALGYTPFAAYLVGAVLLVAGMPGGIAVAAVGALAAIIVALIVSWVVLVEVLR